jgi:hypothetical protein
MTWCLGRGITSSVAALLFIALSGCASDPAKDMARPIYQIGRFVPLPESAKESMIYSVPRAFLALDTVSGQMCLTVSFRWDNSSAEQKTLQNLPQCSEIYVNSNIPLPK